MKKLTRRNFVKIALIASASAAPVVRLIAKYLGLDARQVGNGLTGDFNYDHEFHLIDNNLLNLHFYFINVKKKGRFLVPDDQGRDAFMIVRLPHQHVSEAGFWSNNWTDGKNNKPVALMSGFSYLAFQLWWRPNGRAASDNRLTFTVENLLNWNDESSFRLITLIDWLRLKGETSEEFNFVKLKVDNVNDCRDFQQKKIWGREQWPGTPPIVLEGSEPRSDVYKRYRLIVRRLFEQNINRQSSFAPVSFFEVPHEVCLVPINPSRESAPNQSAVKKRFWKNHILPKPEKNDSRKYEIWSNALFYERPKSTSDEIESSGKKKFVFESPSFRIAGLISERELQCGSHNPAAPCAVPSDPTANPKIDDIIPTFLTKAELTHLTQYARQGVEDRLVSEFDIKELNNFVFSGLGVFAHLRYESTKKLPPLIDLIEYEHRITQGRDVFIKVARLGYNSKTGQKYKHVIEGKRKIQTEAKTPINPKDPPLASFIELKQYCECIEHEIVYTQFPDNWETQDFISYAIPGDEIQKPVVNRCHYRRNAFRTLRIKDKKRVPIDCLRDEIQEPVACVLENLDWFWVIKEGPVKSGNTFIKDSDVPIDRYLPCQYEATDWEGVTHEVSTPFMFVRKSYVEKVNDGRADPNAADGAYRNYLKGNYEQNPRDALVERKLTHFLGKKVAFTPSPPKPDSKLFINETPPAYDSKTNILETEYFESYFRLKNTKQQSDPDYQASQGGQYIGEMRYLVFPQVLRARVFLDHIRDITLQKTASVVDYHDHYIRGGFEKEFSENGERRKNYGKLILQNTEAYKTNVEEPVNRTYNTIKTALQQAKNRLGNLAVPDIVPDAISLDVSGITLPPDISSTINRGQATFDFAKNKLEQLSPRALLRGKVSEILGGIDLNAILDELIPQEDSPLFELKKFANELEKITSEIATSPVYQGLLQKLNALKEQIDLVLREVNTLLREINTLQAQVNGLLRTISEKFPNADELDSLTKKQFERFRTRAFEVVLGQLEFAEVKAKIDGVKQSVYGFLDQELAILKLEYDAKLKELETFFTATLAEIQAELPQFPPVLRQIDGLNLEAYFDRELRALYQQVVNGLTSSPPQPFFDYKSRVEKLYRTVQDNVQVMAGGRVVYYRIIKHSTVAREPTAAPLITWELTDSPNDAESLFDLSPGAGFVQLKKKLDDFRALVAGSIQSTTQFHKDAVAELLRRTNEHETIFRALKDDVESFQLTQLEKISKKIREWSDTAEKFRVDTSQDPKVKEAVRKVQELVLKANSYVDFVRKVDPYFYYTEQERLKKDLQDIRRRFSPALAALYGKDVFEEIDCTQPGFTVACEVKKGIIEYEKLRRTLKEYATDPTAEAAKLKSYVADYQKLAKDKLDRIGKDALLNLQTPEITQALEDLQRAKETLEAKRKDYTKKYEEYLSQVRAEATEAGKEITSQISEQIEEWERELSVQVDPSLIQQLQSRINEARNIFRLLTSIKQQELSYKWSTTNFHDVNLGILTFKKFSAPDTRLAVDVKITTHFAPGKFPPAIERIETSALNRLTNFGVGFFSVLTVGFSEVSFQAKSGESPKFAVKIKDVKFDGSLSFVQEFEKWMAGKGLILRIEADRLILGYSLPLPAIQTPSFSFFNLSLNFDIRLYFDNRPMRFRFSFARPDLKFGIAAGIYAGFGFFGLVGEPKRGIVEMDAALEAGAWKGISIGPISGEVKLAFGFRYTRNDSGVRLEGYIVAEGRLSVWIIEVAARIYLGVVSENSYVEGRCTVTYSAKLGFVKKSFSGSFHQKISGAKRNNNEENAGRLVAYSQKFMTFMGIGPLTTKELSLLHRECVSVLDKAPDGKPETKAISRNAWKKFARVM